jgi:hypothetical protein
MGYIGGNGARPVPIETYVTQVTYVTPLHYG